jgi:hypothetical protein
MCLQRLGRSPMCGLTSAAVRPVVTCAGARLPRLSLSCRVPSTDRFTKTVADLLLPPVLGLGPGTPNFHLFRSLVRVVRWVPDIVRHDCIVTDWPFPDSDGVPSPQIVAAWTQLGLLPTENVPLWAAHWLVAGYDGECLVSLAGLHGDDPHDVRDALPGALLDCGVAIPNSDMAAAFVSFTHLARMHVDGLAGPKWVGQKVEEVLVKSGYAQEVIDLPLGRLYYIADEWGAGWGRTDQELAAIVREACEEQLRNGSVAA